MYMMLVMPFRRYLRRHASRLAKDTRGLAAVEFAMIVPLMLVTFFGMTEVTTAVAVNRKVTIATRTDVAGRFGVGRAVGEFLRGKRIHHDPLFGHAGAGNDFTDQDRCHDAAGNR